MPYEYDLDTPYPRPAGASRMKTCCMTHPRSDVYLKLDGPQASARILNLGLSFPFFLFYPVSSWSKFRRGQQPAFAPLFSHCRRRPISENTPSKPSHSLYDQNQTASLQELIDVATQNPGQASMERNTSSRFPTSSRCRGERFIRVAITAGKR